MSEVESFIQDVLQADIPETDAFVRGEVDLGILNRFQLIKAILALHQVIGYDRQITAFGFSRHGLDKLRKVIRVQVETIRKQQSARQEAVR